MTSDDVSETDVDAVAAALRWTIGRSPRDVDEAADRRLLRDLVARLEPDVDRAPAARDARLDQLLAEMAASDELADHCAARHRPWIGDVARIYFCAPEDLPPDIRDRIGSETILAHLTDGVSNRARAAARALGIDDNVVRVRREPVVLDAAAAALVARLAVADGPRPAAETSPPPGPTTPASPSGSRSRALVRAVVLAAVALSVAAGALVALTSRGTDEGRSSSPTVAVVGEAPAVLASVSVLGIDDAGALVAVSAGGLVPLGVEDVVAADAARDGDVLHVVVEQAGGRLVHAALGPRPSRWVGLGTGLRGPEVGVATDGQAEVVAIRSDDGDLVRRRVGLDGEPEGDWAPLSATDVVDVDVTVNLDGRLEVGGVTSDGTAFNIWQSEPPHGWSSYSDDRGGTAGRRVQLLTNRDGRLEIYAERADRTLWNTWQVAQGRGWFREWNPRHVEDLRRWRVAVGADARLVAVALTDTGVILRRQVPVPQADGSVRMMWPPATVVEPLDPLGGATPTDVTVVSTDDGARVVATGAGRTTAIEVGLDTLSPVRPLAAGALATLVPVDG
ncbi:hypothetical protein HC251_13750 [Iamia sp. SCSIO 61187]|uniref:hypothetical protein n=1 Tax=Iamia sp. SCSIO 61187 TaxID=2722752 RepID=UPI001C6395DC|nr:hypothetical protein [Iamia sp. SCSIO 61187]QYG93382.1 hypothetical protein HC251_13750 [Iamia sp. SCSIO 61187]